MCSLLVSNPDNECEDDDNDNKGVNEEEEDDECKNMYENNDDSE